MYSNINNFEHINHVNFICNKSMEKFDIEFSTFNKNKRITKNQILFTSQNLGIAFCSLLNSKYKILNFLSDVTNDINKHINLLNPIYENNVQYIFEKIILINNYMILSYNLFNEINNKLSFSLDSRLTHHNLATNSIDKDFINLLYLDSFTYLRNKISNIFDNIELIIKSDTTEYTLPYSNILVKNNLYLYNYKINNLEELLYTEYYHLNINRFHIKKCKSCDKYFVTKDDRIKFCNNPSPINPLETCYTLPKKYKYNDDEAEKHWEIEINNLKPEVKNAKQFFYDHIKNTLDKRKKQILENNKIKFKEIEQELRKLILNFSKQDNNDKNLNLYLKIYKDFILEVRANQKHNPPNLIVKKPKYKKPNKIN